MHLATFKPVELARSADRVSTHIAEPKPVPDHEVGRQGSGGADTIYGIAGRAPNTAQGLCNFVWVNWSSQIFPQRNDVGMDVLVIKHDAVECAVHTIVDVIYVTT